MKPAVCVYQVTSENVLRTYFLITTITVNIFYILRANSIPVLMSLPGYVVPGQLVLGHDDPHFDRYILGSGVEKTDRGIVATILGRLDASKVMDENDKNTKQSNMSNEKWQINVTNEFRNPYAQIPIKPCGNSKRSTSQLPQVGDVVYARVLRLGANQVTLDIIAVENKGLILSDNGVGIHVLGSIHTSSGTGDRRSEISEGYGAIIRIQDIRATGRDKLVLSDQFNPGDLVRASVLSLGDGQHYYLSTIQNDLGVVFAKDPHTNQQLIPLDWETMVNPVTGVTYPRICANPFV